MDTHTLSGQWQHLKASARSAWARFTHAYTRQEKTDQKRTLSMIHEKYSQAREKAALATDSKPEKKDVLQKMSEVNGNMKINEYVENPAPGPSERHGEQGSNKAREETGKH